MIHEPNCNWEKSDCEYKATHHYCPHPEHACTCSKTEKYDVFADPIFDLLNCYEIDGSEVHDGMAHIDSGEAETLTRKIREILKNN